MNWEHTKIPNNETGIFCNKGLRSKTRAGKMWVE